MITIKRSFLALLIVVPAMAFSGEPIQPIQPIEITSEVHQAKIDLGRRLFYDKRLSTDQSFSCHTCHRLADGGDDNVKMSMGGRFSKRNSPTLLNVSLNFKQLWDGRANTLHDQIDGLGKRLFKFQRGAEIIGADPSYKTLFEIAYGGKVTEVTIKDAIVEYEKYLVTPDSPFDRFLKGEKDAISDEAKRGYDAFKKYRCIGCHNGENVGGSMFQRFGVHQDANLLNPEHTDFGRFNITKAEHHRHVFKVPSLRHAVNTEPYLHDGSVKTIEEMVKIMSRLQVGNVVPSQDQKAIIEFLKTLPGKLPEKELEYAKKLGGD